MTETLRWGILSTANIGVKAVIPATQASTQGEVVAIASRDGARASDVADRLGIPKAHESYDALLADPDVDAIYNPLPNHLHAEWSIKAMEAGKHVLCEKPLAMSAAQAEEMIAKASDAGVVLMEAFMYKTHPQWQMVRELVTSGGLGPLRAVHAWFSYRNLDPDNIRNVSEWGGGGLMDIGCYCISVSRMLFDDEPDEVLATIQRHPEFGTDVLTSAVLRFGDGQATFTCSTIIEGHQRVVAVGEGGAVEVERPFNAPTDSPAQLRLTTDGLTETLQSPIADHYTSQADAFAAAVLDGAPLPVTHADSVGNMTVIEQVLAAAEG